MPDDTRQDALDTLATDHLTELNGVAITLGPATPKAIRTKVGYGIDGVFRDSSFQFPFPTLTPANTVTGTITATDIVVGTHAGAGVLLTGAPTAGSFIALALPGSDNVWNVQLFGTLGGGTYWFESSISSTNGIDGLWTTLSMRTLGTTGSINQDSATVAGMYRGNAGGMAWVRLRVTGATTPSASVVLRSSISPGPLAINAPLPAGINRIGEVGLRASDLGVTATAAAAAAATLTLPAPAAGLFIYITGLTLTLFNSAARTGSATPVLVTTSNLPGGPVFTLASAGAVGVTETREIDCTSPIKSTASGTATTVVAPAIAGILWRITARYYTAI